MKQTLKYIYEKLQDNMKFAESKHSMTIALAGGIVVFASAFLDLSTTFVATLSAGCIIFALISVLYSFIALSARKVHFKKYRGDAEFVENLMYYKTIMKFDEISYVNTIQKTYNLPKSYKPDEMDLDLARQIISVAKVTNVKFAYFNLSLVFLFLSLMCAVGSIILLGLEL